MPAMRTRLNGDSMDRRPLLCAFGTRLDPDELLAGLDALGLGDARLFVDDAGVRLACVAPDVRRDGVARGLTFLIARFSPLVPVRAVALDEVGGAGARFVDERRRTLLHVALAELCAPTDDDALRHMLVGLLGRLSTPPLDGSATPSARPPSLPPLPDGPLAQAARQLVPALHGALEVLGLPSDGATVSVLVPSGLRAAGPLAAQAASMRGPHLLLWLRPGASLLAQGGAEAGVRPAVIVAAAWEMSALARLWRALDEDAAPFDEADDAELLLDGLAWRVARRPTIAVAAPSPAASPIQVDAARCTDCGVCAAVCPTDYLGARGLPATDDASRCVRCYECVDACPTDALRPTLAADTATRERALAHRPGWLARLAGAPGPSFPAPFPPSYLVPRRADVTRGEDPPTPGKPRYVLGLAVMTQQEHAAVLLRDGVIVGAVEHERLVRKRHGGWSPPGRPGVTVAVDPTLCIEEAFCRRPIRALLEREGITLDDIERFAFNGLHGRYAHLIAFTDGSVPLPTMRAGRAVYLPHHLCHAASAFRPSGAESAWVLTVDGRGDRESMALFRAEHGRIEPVDTLLALCDRSIGGVYEGVTRLLGFGSHGQGSVMALGAFGEPRCDMGAFLGSDEEGRPHVHQSGINDAFAALGREPDAPLTQDQKDLAASLQAALETTLLAFLRRHVGEQPIDALCLGGGVALNCRANEHLRRSLAPKRMFVQPGANDAGTAFGAALEAWADLTEHKSPTAEMRHAYLGPAFTDDEIEAALRRSGLRYRRSDAIAEDTAALLADGQIVCWFQGGMEFGPRALGGRSILADPRHPAIADRVNDVKERERWRPFGPSILAGHEGEWFDGAFDARFMVFTLPVLEAQRARVPAIVHVDGTTRPQVVHAEHAPAYHALISAFHRRTGVPMVLNTSFNRRGEPIVCTPADAIASFRGLAERGADLLAIGSFLVEPVPREQPAIASDDALAALPGGRRLALRLTTACDFDCGHCTLRDLREKTEGSSNRSVDEAVRALAEGREAGCDELALLRGEAALRPDLPALVARAKRMGYRFVQLQTNGAALADARRRDALLAAGLDSVELMLLAADEALHDELSAAPGSFRAVLVALRALAASGRQLLVSVPVLRKNLHALPAIVALARKLGAARVQFNFPRPVELRDRVRTDDVPRLAHAAPHVRQAALLARRLGMSVSTEAIPHCHLPPELRASPDSTEDWRRHRVDDLHLVHESLTEVRRTHRPEYAPCRACSERERCPRTWALYLELFGSDELRPL